MSRSTLRSVVGGSLLLGASALGQGGGFDAGDLYLYSPAIQGISSSGGAIVHVDLDTGVTSILVDTFTTLQQQGAIAFDPYRQRLVFCAGLGSIAAPPRMYSVDAAGNLTDLGFPGEQFSSLAPTGDGRIYLRTNQLAMPMAYLDATGALLPLLDAAGTAPFILEGAPNFDFRGMIFDAASNALFVATTATHPCAGGLAAKVNVRKLPLSANGDRVVGPIGCAQFEVSTSGEAPVGWSRLPGGQLLLVVDTNANALEPRLLSVDPATLAITPFAINNNNFSAATNAGTWCSALGKAVILETGSDKLIAFASGEVGVGSALALTGTNVSSSGSSGEIATLIEIEPSSCAGSFNTYGAGLAGAGGFVPRLLGAGCAGVGQNFTLSIDRVVGGAPGALFVGFAKSNLPFLGGTLLVFPIALQIDLSMPGAAGVPNAGALTIPAALPADPMLAGITLDLQAVFADAAAVKGVSMTQGLEIEIGA
jgi:hypothetical protein